MGFRLPDRGLGGLRKPKRTLPSFIDVHSHWPVRLRWGSDSSVPHQCSGGRRALRGSRVWLSWWSQRPAAAARWASVAARQERRQALAALPHVALAVGLPTRLLSLSLQLCFALTLCSAFWVSVCALTSRSRVGLCSHPTPPPALTQPCRFVPSSGITRGSRSSSAFCSPWP